MPITMIVPTQGRATLERLLGSVKDQGLTDGDEVIVAIDAHEMSAEAQQEIADRVEAVAAGSPGSWRTIAVDAGRHTWGHDQINAALDMAAPGNYIHANDDDDIYAPGAFDAIRRAAAADLEQGTPHVHIFRFQAWFGQVLPKGEQLMEGGVGGHSLVTPNLPGKVGRMTARYAGDWDWIKDTVERWGDDVAFHQDIIAIARPPAR